MLLRRSLPLVVVVLASGCSIGTISRLDGEWPIRPSAEEEAPALFRQVASGQDGSIVMSRLGEDALRIVAHGEDRGLDADGLDLTGAIIRGDALYRCDRGRLRGGHRLGRLRRRLGGGVSPVPVAYGAGLAAGAAFALLSGRRASDGAAEERPHSEEDQGHEDRAQEAAHTVCQ